MRKVPRQKRSRALVDSLVEAATLVIAEEGLESATTVRIAERAGVSVGSLYQYFDRKEDIYEAVLDRVAQQLEVLVAEEMRRLPNGEISSFVRELLNRVWAFLEADDGRYLSILRYWVQLDGMYLISKLEQKVTLAMGSYLIQNPPAKPIEGLAAKTYIFVNAVMFTLARFISDPPLTISREQLLDEFVSLSESLLFR